MASCHDRLPAGLLDFRLGRFGELRGSDLQRAADFTIAEDLHRRLVRPDETVGREHLRVDLADRRIEGGERPDIHHRELRAVIVIVETAVRELAVQRHLAAFKARADAAAGAGRLALAALAARLAMTAAFAAADALLPVHRTRNVLQFV